MFREDDRLAFYAPLSRECGTRRLTMKKIAAINVTPVEMAPGYYQCRCAAGLSTNTITGKLGINNTPVADTTLTMPAAGAAETAGLMSAPGDAWFSLFIDPDHTFLALAWDGAADDILILTRMNFS